MWSEIAKESAAGQWDIVCPYPGKVKQIGFGEDFLRGSMQSISVGKLNGRWFFFLGTIVFKMGYAWRNLFTQVRCKFDWIYLCKFLQHVEEFRLQFMTNYFLSEWQMKPLNIAIILPSYRKIIVAWQWPQNGAFIAVEWLFWLLGSLFIVSICPLLNIVCICLCWNLSCNWYQLKSIIDGRLTLIEYLWCCSYCGHLTH